MTNNTEAVIKATTEYDLAVLPEHVEECEEFLRWLMEWASGSHWWVEYAIVNEGEVKKLQSTLDRLKRRGE